jgi:hypothetical protein
LSVSAPERPAKAADGKGVKAKDNKKQGDSAIRTFNLKDTFPQR